MLSCCRFYEMKELKTAKTKTFKIIKIESQYIMHDRFSRWISILPMIKLRSAVMNVLEHKKTHIQRLMTSSFVFILNYSVLNFWNTLKVKILMNQPSMKSMTNDLYE